MIIACEWCLMKLNLPSNFRFSAWFFLLIIDQLVFKQDFNHKGIKIDCINPSYVSTIEIGRLLSKYCRKLKWLTNLETFIWVSPPHPFSILNDPNSPQYLKSMFRFLFIGNQRFFLIWGPIFAFRANSFVVVAVGLWNDLPQNIKKSSTKPNALFMIII